MCNLFKKNGEEFRPGSRIYTKRFGGALIEENTIWTGPATSEGNMWNWWLKKPGAELVEIEADEFREKETWGPVPKGYAMAAVALGWEKAKTVGVPDYRPVKIYTMWAAPEEKIFFNHDRMPIFGRLKAPGEWERMAEKLTLPQPPKRAKEDLFG